jgi:hypothetical protein
MARPPADPTGNATPITIRLAPGHLDRLDIIRGDRSRTDAIRSLIDNSCRDGAAHRYRVVGGDSRNPGHRQCIVCGAR